jgi:hypothetical protein
MRMGEAENLNERPVAGRSFKFLVACSKYRMKCSSAHRCVLASCEKCCWRASLHVTRQVLSTSPQRLYILEFAVDITFDEFANWRSQFRNSVEYKRRVHSYFRGLGLWCWLMKNGQVRGILDLGRAAPDEFIAAFGQRWPVTLQPVQTAALRNDIFFMTRPCMIAEMPSQMGRYHPVRFTVRPQSYSGYARGHFQHVIKRYGLNRFQLSSHERESGKFDPYFASPTVCIKVEPGT